MEEDQRNEVVKELIKHFDERALHSHQSRDKEISGLVRDIQRRIDSFVDHLDRIQSEIEQMKGDLRAFRTQFVNFDKKTVNYDLTTKIVYGMVGLLLTAAMGAIIALIIR